MSSPVVLMVQVPRSLPEPHATVSTDIRPKPNTNLREPAFHSAFVVMKSPLRCCGAVFFVRQAVPTSQAPVDAPTIVNPPGALSLLPDRVVDDPAQLRASVQALMALDFDALILGDGVSILEGAKERLGELVARTSG